MHRLPDTNFVLVMLHPRNTELKSNKIKFSSCVSVPTHVRMIKLTHMRTITRSNPTEVNIFLIACNFKYVMDYCCHYLYGKSLLLKYRLSNITSMFCAITMFVTRLINNVSCTMDRNACLPSHKILYS